MKIYDGYRHPPEVVGEAEGFFLHKATLICKVTTISQSSFHNLNHKIIKIYFRHS